MSISSISEALPKYETTAAGAAKNVEKEEEADSKELAKKGVVYEKSAEKKRDSANQIYDRDAIVSKLKADQQARAESMRSLVEKLFTQQGNKYNTANSKNLSGLFKQAAAMADPATIAQAQQDISEDGYWGVNKTSDRLVSMAIALSGGNTEKADEMMEAIKKGFDRATAAWGDDLPDICQRTLDATEQKMEDWKSGKTSAQDYTEYLS